MTADTGDRFLERGTQVRLSKFHFEDEEAPKPEYGVVVHCWKSEQVGGYDCYVAFFGDKLPHGAPTERPYILRYAASSLISVDVMA